MTYRTAL